MKLHSCIPTSDLRYGNIHCKICFNTMTYEEALNLDSASSKKQHSHIVNKTSNKVLNVFKKLLKKKKSEYLTIKEQYESLADLIYCIEMANKKQPKIK